MADKPDLDLRRRVAEKLGWTKLHLNTNQTFIFGVSPKTNDNGTVPPYELSVDAGLRDLVPTLLEKADYFDLAAEITPDGNTQVVAHWDDCYTEPEPTHARAICRAFLEDGE